MHRSSLQAHGVSSTTEEASQQHFAKMEMGWRSLRWTCDFSPPSTHTGVTSLSLRTNTVAIQWHGCPPQNKAVAGTDQQRPWRVWHGRHTPIREQPGLVTLEQGRTRLPPVQCLLVNFVLKSSPANQGSLEQKLYSSSGFYFFFNYYLFKYWLLSPTPRLLFSLQSNFKPYF